MAVDISMLPSPIRGVCYQPAPTDYNGNQGAGQKYFDTDFFNADFTGLWSQAGGGRGDLANMADLGINFIHLYDWNPPPARDHTGFLTTCASLGLGVAVPFNNSFCTNLSSWGANAVYAAMAEIYGNGFAGKPVAMWTIANEYNQGGGPTPAQIAQVAQIILYYEAQNSVTTLLPISSPTSFAPASSPGIQPTQALQAAFAATTAFPATIGTNTVTIPALPASFFSDRYIAATNPQNPGSIPPASSGVTIESWLPQYQTAFPNTPLWFSEIGIGVYNSCNGWSSCTPSAAQQAAFTLNQLQAADPAQYSFLLGSCIYEYTPDYQNSVVPVPNPPANNYTFSLLSDNNATSASQSFTIPSTAPYGGGSTYAVQCLNTSKPVYAAVRGLWNPTAPPRPAQWCATPPNSTQTIYANRTWHQTEIIISSGQTVAITYQEGSDIWTADPQTNGGQLYDAAGCPGLVVSQPFYPLMGAYMGALVGRVGANGTVFLVGNGPTSVPAGQTGPLFLVINDDLEGIYGAGLKDNYGYVTVQIVVS